MTISGQLAVG